MVAAIHKNDICSQRSGGVAAQDRRHSANVGNCDKLVLGRTALQEALAAATRLGEAIHYVIEYRIIHPDGSQRWVFAKERLSFEGAGLSKRVTSFDGTVAYIADRKRVEEAL